jgi:hypothetical protein
MSEYKVSGSQSKNNCNHSFLFLLRFVTEEKVLEIEVEAGVADGYQIPFVAEGLFSHRTYFLFDNQILFCFLQENLILKVNQVI